MRSPPILFTLSSFSRPPIAHSFSLIVNLMPPRAEPCENIVLHAVFDVPTPGCHLFIGH